MKIFKIAVIALIAAASFSTSADAQVIVKARIGSGHVVERRPVRRTVVRHRPYRRRVIVRHPVRHRRVVVRDRRHY